MSLSCDMTLPPRYTPPLERHWCWVCPILPHMVHWGGGGYCCGGGGSGGGGGNHTGGGGYCGCGLLCPKARGGLGQFLLRCPISPHWKQSFRLGASGGGLCRPLAWPAATPCRGAALAGGGALPPKRGWLGQWYLL